MLQLMVTNEENEEAVAIKKFLEWQNVWFQMVFNPDDVRYLNQGGVTPLLMQNSMIVARGFYEIVNYTKVEGTNLHEKT